MLIDLSHAIEDGLMTYPGLPAPRISDHLARDASAGTYAPGTTFQIGRIDMVANTGTYLDAPFHRFADGADIADLSLDEIADLEGLLVSATEGEREGRGIGASFFSGTDLRRRAVLIHTGWSRHFSTAAYGEGHPFLKEDAVAALVNGGAALVGIDSLNIDDTADLRRPAHTRLLESGIPIVEHLRGLDLLTGPFRFFAVPVKVRGLGSFPVRAFAVTASAEPRRFGRPASQP